MKIRTNVKFLTRSALVLRPTNKHHYENMKKFPVKTLAAIVSSDYGPDAGRQFFDHFRGIAELSLSDAMNGLDSLLGGDTRLLPKLGRTTSDGSPGVFRFP